MPGKTYYNTAATLDGFVADDHHSLDWLFQLGDPEEDTFSEFIKTVGALAMGSSTYEWVLKNHIKPDSDQPQPWPYQQPTWVFSSRSLPRIEDASLHFVSGDVRPVHAAMVAAAGEQNVWIVGGGDLAGQFYDAGLLDEIIVTVASVTLGRGAPLLPRAITDRTLRLRSAKALGDAFAELRYAVVRSS